MIWMYIINTSREALYVPVDKGQVQASTKTFPSSDHSPSHTTTEKNAVSVSPQKTEVSLEILILLRMQSHQVETKQNKNVSLLCFQCKTE